METQMYKIYINGKPVFLVKPDNPVVNAYPPDKNTFNAIYQGKKKFIFQYIDLLEKNKAVRAVVLQSNDLETLWLDFQRCYKRLDAAGGYVLNSQNELLVFYRRGSWDMPKGKIDPGETPEQAALREVMEETGLQNLVLGPFLCHTYHTYEQKGDRILKCTWWYRMTTTDADVVPQTEEDIEEIKWVAPDAWLASGPEVYDSIRDVIDQGMQQ